MVHEYVHLLIGALGAAAIIVVFDGDRFPAKAETHRKRADVSEKNETEALLKDAEASLPGADAAACRETARNLWKRVLNRKGCVRLAKRSRQTISFINASIATSQFTR